MTPDRPEATVCCEPCRTRAEWQDRWDQARVGSIRRVLECHALGAEVIALKDPKYERLAALHALDALHEMERELVELRMELGR